MKRVLAVSLACLIVAGSAVAAPVGYINPQMGRFAVAGEVGAVTDRDMKNTTTSRQTSEVESVYYVGRIAYGLSDVLEIYGRLGGADADVNGLAGGATSVSTSGEFAWGGGLQGIIYNAGTWNLAGDAQYFAHSDHQAIATNGVTQDFDWKEWQIGLQVQGEFEQFFPYLGVKYSDLDLDYERPSAASDVEADDNVGVYVGTGFNLAGNWSGYLEGRFIDETAFGGGIRYTF